ncbi:NAD(+) diphosphatase [Legionella brunensis]|uniref:NAD(+) diphosphatase n=1 Tax=Legionella brunensis TaxID=29422 RepID=A0A0W0S0F7_9GAMM|nr:NAD(+) diphosphatase [Legionella brunensis]KTC76975.1 NADH pyrophosphatase [Legionella brunensis]
MHISHENQSNWIIIQNNEILLNSNNSLPSASNIAAIAPYFQRNFNLGAYEKVEYYCAEVDENITLDNSFYFLPLRKALSLMDKNQYGLGVKAYSVINWDKNHQFCGRCGALTLHQTIAFERICTPCDLSFFPRISPSIIVLIHREDHLLMARSPHFLPGIYGLIAGFVEAGESIEEAVYREVKEEVGIRIKNLSYFGSQPWPFPDSLMIAFMAEYESGEILIDNSEIEHADWYRYDNLPGRPSMSFSIASTLLDNFISHCELRYKNK